MKIVKFVHRNRCGEGALLGDHVVAMGPLTEQPPEWLRLTSPGQKANSLLATATGERFALDEIRLVPPIDVGTRVFCVGINYREHAAEAGRDVVDRPSIFLRTIDSLQGHLAPLVRPRASAQYDYEGEIAVVIGQGGRAIAREDALSHVFGYTCFMDGSVRDVQKSSLAAGKNFWRSGAIGPWIVTTDEIADHRSLQLTTRLNGETMQHAAANQMIHDVPSIIASVSTWLPLKPGDVIATGTPSGVGLSRDPPRWLVAGDVIQVDIPGVGVLQNTVEDEA